jgi:hypothetical protein
MPRISKECFGGFVEFQGLTIESKFISGAPIICGPGCPQSSAAPRESDVLVLRLGLHDCQPSMGLGNSEMKYAEKVATAFSRGMRARTRHRTWAVDCTPLERLGGSGDRRRERSFQRAAASSRVGLPFAK